MTAEETEVQREKEEGLLGAEGSRGPSSSYISFAFGTIIPFIYPGVVIIFLPE